MDPREKYMTTLIRSLIRKGIITFVGSAAGAIAVGPYGFAIAPMLTAAVIYFDNQSEEQQVAGWTSMSRNDIVKLALQVAIKLAIENISAIIDICKDIIRLLQRLFQAREETVGNVRELVHYAPSY